MKFLLQPKKKTFNKKGSKFISKNKWYDFQIEKAKKDFKKARTSKIKKNVRKSGRFYKNLLKTKEKTHISKIAAQIRKSRKKRSGILLVFIKRAKKVRCN